MSSQANRKSSEPAFQEVDKWMEAPLKEKRTASPRMFENYSGISNVAIMMRDPFSKVPMRTSTNQSIGAVTDEIAYEANELDNFNLEYIRVYTSEEILFDQSVFTCYIDKNIMLSDH